MDRAIFYQKQLILGATFKENCPDFRNSGTLSIIKSLNKKKIIPHLHDPNCSAPKEKPNAISVSP